MKIRGAITLLLFLAWLIFPAMVLGEENSGVKRARTNQVAPDDITAIRVEPSELVLSNPRYPRRVSISGKLKDGSWIDLSRQAELTPANGFVRVDESGLLYAVKDGESTVEVTAGGRRAELLVTVQGVTEAHPVSFVRDVMPILNKVGCTNGICHGAAKGRNGFKLSLRGYDPKHDYHALIHEVSGRRFNRADPAQSLMLAKPTQQVPHGGGLQIDLDSRYYETLLQWISEGVPFGDPPAARVKRLEVLPDDILLKKPGLSQQLLVLAHYPDGTTRDVITEAVYASNTPTVVEVSEDGFVTTLRKGEAAILIRYEGNFATINVTVLEERPGFRWVQLLQYNYIDRYVDQKLKRLKIQPSQLCTDTEFIRRVSLDLIGLPPTPEEVRAFLNDKTPSRLKRSKLIDRLMARPEFVDHWSLKWADLLQNNRKFLGTKGVWSFRHWIRKSIAENKPYDQFVRELLTATGSSFENPAANFFRATRTSKKTMETTTQLFLGVRMVCAQCHDHPFERWTQNQYYQLAAFFAGIAVKEGPQSEEEIIYLKRDEAEVKHPKSGLVVAPKFPFGNGQAEEISRLHERREVFARWLTSKENPYFTMAIANRLWSYFFGRGIIDPVDDIRSSNPASNGPLLEALTNDLKEHDFDLQHLIRTIVHSRTYQLSFRPNEWNGDDEVNFSHAIPRRLTAEQLLDAISVATGSQFPFKGVPKDFRAAQLPDPFVGKGGFLDVFGRPPRESATEGDRRNDISLTHAINLINGPTVAEAVADANGRIARLMLSGASDRPLVEELYLAALSRLPNRAEYDQAINYLAEGENRAERAQDLLWALLNSSAFLFNR